jgi:GH15 family glucan-1,4-alpha-glucosidase
LTAALVLEQLGRSTYRGRWQEMVNRSALTLKLLTSRTFGSIVAAPTFGLPERVGGGRNWDYRYTWIRDASFTLYGLMRLGFTGEAAAFMRWVEDRCAELEPDGALQVMYGIDGRKRLTEENLPHLQGYKGSKPVRIGNQAYANLQLDIYGELMDAIYLYDKYGAPISHDLWTDVIRFIDWVGRHWREPDESIWEVRGGRQEFLYSRVLCWAAIDRAIRLARKRSFPAPLARWHEERDAIYQDVFAHFWDAGRKTFVQAKGSIALDASSLLLPLVRFIAPTDPRWVSTLRAIERELVSDSLVSRYRIGDQFSDGLSGDEGTFTMCSFWYVECLSRLGDLPQARFFFERMLGYANHLGLYGEELGRRGEHLGNLPAGVHPPGARQRSLRSRPPTLGRWPRGLSRARAVFRPGVGAEGARRISHRRWARRGRAQFGCHVQEQGGRPSRIAFLGPLSSALARPPTTCRPHRPRHRRRGRARSGRPRRRPHRELHRRPGRREPGPPRRDRAPGVRRSDDSRRALPG